MTQSQSQAQAQADTDRLLSALGELQRSERHELSRLDAQADALAAQDPEQASAFEAKLMAELLRRPAPQGNVQSPSKAKLKRSWASSAAVSCAAAAALLLWITHAGQAPPLATSYTLLAPAPDASLRSPAAHSPDTSAGVYSLGRLLSFRLRPAARHSGALRVECYAAPSGGAGEPFQLKPNIELDPAGGARVEIDTGPGSALPIAEGSWELLFYVSSTSAPRITAQQVRARQCPQDTRCLRFNARFVRPQPL